MKIYGISMVRNEADTVGAAVAYHLSLGMDGVMVLDNGSTDGTDRVLRDIAARDPRLTWTRDDSPFDQAAITTELAREAYRRGADWVVPFDADEFWWARGGNLRKILSGSDAGALRVSPVLFVQARDQTESTPEGLLRITMRPARPVKQDEHSRRLVEANELARIELVGADKWISRPTEEIVIRRGNHGVSGVKGKRADCGDIVFLHAPLRSRALLESKLERSQRLTEAGMTRGAWHVWRWARIIEEGRLEEEWAANSYEGEHLDVYGEKHPVVYDPRLRDAVAPHVGGASLGPPGGSPAVRGALSRLKGALTRPWREPGWRT